MRKFLVIIVLIGLSINSIAQIQSKIEGQIKNEVDSEPIPLCHIFLSGTNYGTVSDSSGQFVLLISYAEKINLKVSAIGFQTNSFNITERNPTIYLTPSVTLLNEVQVTAPSEEPKQIVSMAFKSIKRNYIQKPIVLESIYRHVCRDNDSYKRIIDAQIDIYKKQGYRRQETYEKNKDQFKVNELRRSIDQSHQRRTYHQPMALEIILKSDIAALKQKTRLKNKVVNLLLAQESFLNTRKDIFEFTWEGKHQLDGMIMYKIGYQLSDSTLINNQSFDLSTYSGYLYINSENYAIIRHESFVKSNSTSLNQNVFYRKFKDKYALFQSSIEIVEISKDGNRHVVNVDMTVNNVLIEKRKDIEQTRISRNYLASIPYNHDYWSQLGQSIDLSIPDSIKTDLQSSTSLSGQYDQMAALEQNIAVDIVENERRLDSIISHNDTILVVDLWASWCLPCIKEFMASSAKREKLSEMGVEFIMVSIDEDINRWRSTIADIGMERETHIRIGPTSMFLENLDMMEIPRFLIYKKQELVINDAPKPSTEDFEQLMEQLMTN